jgi:hypothetical protein
LRPIVGEEAKIRIARGVSVPACRSPERGRENHLVLRELAGYLAQQIWVEIKVAGLMVRWAAK